MRFASVPLPKNDEPHRSPAAEFVRKLLGEKAPAQPVQGLPEPPADLDQRVRLVGEW